MTQGCWWRKGVRNWLAAGAMLIGGTAAVFGQVYADYHQHFLSPAVAGRAAAPEKPFTAKEMIALLDQAGIRHALVLSQAYQFGNPNKPAVRDEYAQVKRENDWTAQQVALYPERLEAFCGVNPLKEYAVREVERCATIPQLHSGLKLHFGNSDVDLLNAEHVAKLRTVFAAADAHGMAVVVHMHPSVTMKRPYGAAQARAFLTEVLPAAPHVLVQIAHLAGSGGYDEQATDEALAVFADAVRRHDARMSPVYFDVSGVAGLGAWETKKDLTARRIRELGLGRILFGSDGAFGGGMTPKAALEAFHTLPLSKEEFHTIESNRTAYMR